MKSLIAFFARQRVLGNLITLFVIIMGLGAAFLIRRDVFPSVTFDIIRVNTVYPGAGAEEVEKLITNPIEQELKAVDGVRKITSDSTEGLSVIVVELDPDQTTEEEGKREVQDAVDRWTDRPEGSEEPLVVSVNTKQFPVLEVTLRSDRVDLIRLREIARQLRKKLELIDPVARVAPIGYDDLEVQVRADPKKLAAYRVSLQELTSALRNQNVDIPAGDFTYQNGAEQIIRTESDFASPKEVLETVVRANELGQAIRVRDLADARFALEEPTELWRYLGAPTISLTVLKKEMSDAIELADEVKRVMSIEEKRYIGDGLQVGFVNDISRNIRLRLSILNDNLYVGGLLVILVLALALPFRLAMVVSIAIPFSYLATIAVFYLVGASINLVSLIGFILVTGLLVDNTVVIADNSYRKMQEGLSPQESVTAGAGEVWGSVTAAAMVTMSAFVPLALMSGIFGKFVREIPLAVILGLSVTLCQGFFILPGQLAEWVRPVRLTSGAKGWRAKWSQSVRGAFRIYQSGLSMAIRHRYLIVLSSIALFIASSFWGARVMRIILFAPEGVEQFFIRVEAEVGSSLQSTLELIRPIERQVAELPANELETYTSVIGVHQQEQDDPQTLRGSQYGQVAVYLTPSQTRTRTAQEIIQSLRQKVGTPPGALRVSFARVNPGPLVGKPISVGVQGEDYRELQEAAEMIRGYTEKIPGAHDVTDSYVLGREEIRVRVIENEASAAGLSALSVGEIVRSAFDGVVATTIRSLDEEIDVRVQLKQEGANPHDLLKNLKVPNPRGDLVPLARIARFEHARSLSNYEHEDNLREIRITGEVDTNITSASRVNGVIRERVPELQKKFPSLRFVFGGEDQDTRESFASLGRAFVVALFVIFVILVAFFQQVLQPLLLLTTIPLGVISVVWTLWIHGEPISFMGILGTIALAGVVVNNSIVLIDLINQNRMRGMGRTESILDAAGTRLRPVMLTTISAVVGVLPTAYGIGGKDPFVVPIALALGWGLLMGSAMTVFVLPCAVAVLDDVQEWIRRLRSKDSGSVERSRLAG